MKINHTEIKKWSDERAQCISEARQMLRDAAEKGRELDQEKWDRAWNRGEELREKIDQAFVDAAKDREVHDRLDQMGRERPSPQAAEQRWERTPWGSTRAVEEIPDTEEEREWNRFLRAQDRSGEIQTRAAKWDHIEQRVQQTGDGPAGGFAIPARVLAGIRAAEQDMYRVIGLCQRVTLDDAASLSATTLADDLDDGEWTSEVKMPDADEVEFGRRDFNPEDVAKVVLYTYNQARLQPGLEMWLRDRIAYKFAGTIEKAIIDGPNSTTGRGPTGVFSTTPQGVGTGRDKAFASATAVDAAAIIDAAAGMLREPYLNSPSLAWVAHREFYSHVAQLTANGNFLWKQGVGGMSDSATPDMLCGIPVVRSERAPHDFSSGNYVAVLGDWRQYLIVDTSWMLMQKMIELYAAKKQIGLHAIRQIDGGVITDEGFVRMKMG